SPSSRVTSRCRISRPWTPPSSRGRTTSRREARVRPGSARSRLPCSRSPAGVAGEAPHRRQVGYSPRVLALGFVALFLVIGLAVFFVAFRSGPKSPAQTEAERKRKISRPVILALAVVFIGFGVVIPLLSILHNAD